MTKIYCLTFTITNKFIVSFPVYKHRCSFVKNNNFDEFKREKLNFYFITKYKTELKNYDIVIHAKEAI